MKSAKGMSLLELMIAVVIVAILASIAYPSYQSYVMGARREEAKRTLLEAGQFMESYYAVNLNYNGAVSGNNVNNFKTDAKFSDYYTLEASALKNTYTLTAKINTSSAQKNDSCGDLTIKSTGEHGPTTQGCW